MRIISFSDDTRIRTREGQDYKRTVYLVVVVLTLTRITKSVVTGQAPVTLELRNTPGKNTHNPRWYTHISQLTQFMPPPETFKSEIGSQSTMCQVQAGAYVSLLTPGGTKYSDCHPSKTTTYIQCTCIQRCVIIVWISFGLNESTLTTYIQYDMM